MYLRPTYLLNYIPKSDLSVPIPGHGIGGSKYPEEYDDFIPITDQGDYHFANDLTILFGAISSIQTELGLEPSGNVGTIAARLYGQGNIKEDASTVGWRHCVWGEASFDQDALHGADPFPIIDLHLMDFGDNDMGWGEGIPVVFARMGRPSSNLGWDLTGGWMTAMAGGGGQESLFLSYVARDYRGQVITTFPLLANDIHYFAFNWKF